ncbi:hypothetical protein ACKWTF_016617 [Chironomus riparius]
MAKFVALIVFLAVAAIIQAIPVVKRDVSVFARQLVPNQVVYGNGIPGNQAEIVNEHSQIDGNGNYDFGYKQTDLQERHEKGTVAINPETGNFTLDNVIGSYKFVRPDGLWQIVEYRADTNGFAPIIRTEPYNSSL